jgi:hypothetical protein
MSDSLQFHCATCGELHAGTPAFHFAAPTQASAIPVEERRVRVELSEDDCIIDGEHFFLKGLLEIPIQGAGQPFTWGVWVSVSEKSYLRFAELFEDPLRETGEWFFGWLCSSIPGYPDTHLLKTNLHVREFPIRPFVELEPTDDPIAIDQRNGISRDRAVHMAESLLHPPA